MKKPQLVEISWIDAWGSTGWDDVQASRHACTGAVCTSVGYVLERNEQGYKLSSSLDLSNDNANGVFFRPHGMIKKVRKL